MEKQNKKLTGWKDFIAILITILSSYIIGLLLAFLVQAIGYPDLSPTVGIASGIFITVLGILISNGKTFKSTIRDIQEISKETINLIYAIGISIVAVCVLALILLGFFGIFSWLSSLPATTIIIVLLVLLLLKK
ncbi:MAG: hypothetical protein AAB531_01890 [Patescibacteria group bacterium]